MWLPLVLALLITAKIENAFAILHQTSHFISVCNHASEPTFGEIFSFISPINPDDIAELAGAVAGSLHTPHDEPPKKTDNNEGKRKQHHWLLVQAFKDIVGSAAKTLSEVSDILDLVLVTVWSETTSLMLCFLLPL